MAYHYIDVDQTLSSLFSGFVTNGVTYLTTDYIYLRYGATLTIDITPPTILGSIAIKDGHVLIDGANAVTPIHIIGLESKYIYPYGRGKATSTRGWYELAISDGTPNQVIDSASYWAGSIQDLVTGCWVETGRRINYTGGSIIPPSIDDYISEVADKDNFGRIVSVADNGDGSGYIVVKWINRPMIDGTSIEVRGIVDNDGPDNGIKWSGTMNGPDVLEPDVFMEFGNTCANFVNCNNNLGIGAWGTGFFSAPGTTTLIFGDGINGMIPPNGARIRLPMISMSTSTVANYDLGIIDSDKSSWAKDYQFKGSYTGSFDLDGIMFSSAIGVSYVSTNYSAKYCVSPIELGGYKIPTESKVSNCIVIDDPLGTRRASRTAFGVSYNVVGTTVKDSLVVQLGGYISGAALYPIRSSNVVYKRCVVLTTQLNASLKTTTSTNILFEDCLITGAKNLISASGGVTINNLKYSCNSNGAYGTLVYYNFYVYNYCQDIDIKGVDIHNHSLNADAFILVGDSYHVKIRCIGDMYNKHDRLALSTYGARIVSPCDFTEISRCWFKAGKSEEFVLGASTQRGISIKNCSGDYMSTIFPTGVDAEIRGMHGGGGQIGNSTNGLRTTYTSVQGINYLDIFRSDTTGVLAMVLTEPTAKTNALIRKSRPTLKTDNSGLLNMIAGDVYEIEQEYMMRGHNTFTGDVAFSYYSGVLNDGQDEVTAERVVSEFQFDTGSGWNGTWLDLRVPSNLTDIGNIVAGVKVKIRMTCIIDKLYVGLIILHTTTTLAGQQANMYPIDQVSYTLTVSSLEVGADVVILEAGTSNVLTSVDQVVGNTFDYVYSVPTVVDIGVIKPGYKTLYLYGYQLATSDADLPMVQLVDRDYI